MSLLSAIVLTRCSAGILPNRSLGAYSFGRKDPMERRKIGLLAAAIAKARTRTTFAVGNNEKPIHKWFLEWASRLFAYRNVGGHRHHCHPRGRAFAGIEHFTEEGTHQKG